MRRVRPVSVLLLTVSPALAQLAPGNLIATTRRGNVTDPGAMYVCDLTGGSVTPLAISANLQKDGLNAVVMTGPAAGYLATAPANRPGDLYRFTLSQRTVAETKLNSAPMPGLEVGQLALSGSDLYFVCRNPSGLDGFLGKIPAAGGTPSVVVDFSQIPGYRGTGVTALAIGGNTAYVGTFDAGASNRYGAQVFAVDLTNPTRVAKVADLPRSKAFSGMHNIGIVNLQLDPGNPNRLVAGGMDGDILAYDLTSQTLVGHDLVGIPLPGLDSIWIDPVSGDVLCGTTWGSIDLFVLTQTGKDLFTGIQGTVTGMWLLPFPAGSYRPFLAGCPGTNTGGLTPTSYGIGAPTAGNSSHRLGVLSGPGAGLALLFLGRSNTNYQGLRLPFDLAPIGLPGCQLGVSIEATFFASLNGFPWPTYPFWGGGSLALPIPAGASGLVAYSQWLTFDSGLALNAISDCRRLSVQ